MERRTGSPQPVVFLIDGQPADQDVYAETMRRFRDDRERAPQNGAVSHGKVWSAR